MAHALRRGIGSIGVGGLAEVANQVPRSYRQAVQALRVRTGSVDPHGVTIDDGRHGHLPGKQAGFRPLPRPALPCQGAATCHRCRLQRVHELNPVRCRLRVEKLFDAQRMAERYERIYWAVARSRVPARRAEPSVNDARCAHHCPVLHEDCEYPVGAGRHPLANFDHFVLLKPLIALWAAV